MQIDDAYIELENMLKEKYPAFEEYRILKTADIPKGKYKPVCRIAITNEDIPCLVEEFFIGAVDIETEKDFIAFFMTQYYGAGYAWYILGTKPKNTICKLNTKQKRVKP